jgi:signal transduction histidine kinase
VITATSEKAGWCRIQVRDNGVGIPERALGLIFQRFARMVQPRERQSAVEGLGLGLSIVDDCVQTMAGQLEVASTEGVGSIFTLGIPASPAA